MPIARDDRMSGPSVPDGLRSPSKIDRDRILYSMPFRRLAGVTQVVSPGEGEIFHNHLTHSLKVAQIARRFAEHFCEHHAEQVKSWGGLDPEVVEAAALAHDLGHPPFGHIAEEELDRLISLELCKEHKQEEDPEGHRHEGYEGNAQSFRIVTELAVRRPDHANGLDLTRATLNATLKYPWKWKENPRKPRKYGAYLCDDAAFQFAREGALRHGIDSALIRSVEAQIMDWSDDIAYSVHDTEDFYRAGLIPLDRLAIRGEEYNYFLQNVKERSIANDSSLHENPNFEKIARILFARIKIREPYRGTREQQEYLYDYVSSSIDKYVRATTLTDPATNDGEAVKYPAEIKLEVAISKELIWTYVIENPSLAGHQLGQRRAIRRLFREYNQAVLGKQWSLFPPFFRDRARSLNEKYRDGAKISAGERVRLVSDTISSMTDKQALLVYQQFSGLSPGSMLDPVVG